VGYVRDLVPGPPRGAHFGPVLGQNADPVAGLVAAGRQMVRESVRALVELAVADTRPAGDQRHPVGRGVRHALEEIREIELHPAGLQSSSTIGASS
jgi:hypothetical protein